MHDKAVSKSVLTLSENEQKVERYLERKKHTAPKVVSKTFEEDGGDSLVLLARYSEALGSVSDDFRSLIFKQVEALGTPSEKVTLLNAVLAFLNSFKPQNEMETMLLTEAFMLHNLAAEMSRRLMISTDPKLSDSIVNRIDKLLRSLRETVSAFQRLRGQGVQQKVTVEHVHVHQGGQAIVGAVEHTGGKGGKS